MVPLFPLVLLVAAKRHSSWGSVHVERMMHGFAWYPKFPPGKSEDNGEDTLQMPLVALGGSKVKLKSKGRKPLLSLRIFLVPSVLTNTSQPQGPPFENARDGQKRKQAPAGVRAKKGQAPVRKLGLGF